MIKTKTLKIPLYDCLDFCIVLTDNIGELQKYTGIEFPYSELLGAVCIAPGKKGKNTVYLCLNCDDSDYKDSVLVHEALHVVNRVFGHICAKPDFYNDEPQAYLLEWVYDETTKFVNKYRDECNKKTTGS